VSAIVDTITVQQAGTDEDFDAPTYAFSRSTTVATDTLQNGGLDPTIGGRGPPAKRCGLSKSAFRASDDAVTLPFHIPDNAYAAVQLREVAPLLVALNASGLAAAAAKLGAELDAAIQKHGIVRPAGGGAPYYAYEVDGYGNALFMDDANVPSLLALPYMGYLAKDDPIYLETRRRVLSAETNPWYFHGAAGAGVGGPHIGTGYIWPMAIVMQALTSDDDAEITRCLELLTSTTAGTLFMHESFHKENASKFTRRWFSWANSLFGTLIITLAKERPHLIFKAPT